MKNHIHGSQNSKSMDASCSNGSNTQSYNYGSFVSNGISELPNCACGLKPVMRTVTKWGPNRGRKFWGCRNFVSHDIECRCNYFVWDSDYMPQTQQRTPQQLHTQCLECPQKELEIMTLRNVILKMHGDHKSTIIKMKLLLFLCVLFGVACVVLLLILALK
uniref:Uncharacterized protein LOC101511697 n=1 Tax=Cicer arietinum TaxID=3827 RepID=A0A3Q7YD45_CICAR|nr:uncharacterized protein LOC101511697 [Cicer arietinum]